MPRSSRLRSVRLHRAAASVAAAVLLVAAGAFAAQAEYAGPSTTPAAPATPAPAAVPHDNGGPRWNELSAGHRKVLAPLAADWDKLDARSKERWIDVAGRFPKLPPDEQRRATQRMDEWAHMSVAQRQRARMNFQETRGVSPAEREARWKAYQALPEDQKRELAKRAAAPASSATPGAPAARRHPSLALDVVQPKTNLVSAAPRAGLASGAATGRPGVTTPLLTRRATPPAHQPDGQPKIAAGPNAVDRKTLLPKHATVAATTAASAAPTQHR